MLTTVNFSAVFESPSAALKYDPVSRNTARSTKKNTTTNRMLILKVHIKNMNIKIPRDRKKKPACSSTSFPRYALVP